MRLRPGDRSAAEATCPHLDHHASSRRSIDESSSPLSALPHGCLCVVALLVAWRPPSVHPSSCLALAAIVVLTGWGVRRMFRGDRLLLVALALAVLVAGSGLSGWDPARGARQGALLAVVALVVALASRVRPPASLPFVLASGIALLGLWGILQAVFGVAVDSEAIAGLDPEAAAYVSNRLGAGRAFASMPLPGHLAVLLTMSMLVLLEVPRQLPRWWLTSRWPLIVVAGAGVVLTKSPLGIAMLTGGLALMALQRPFTHLRIVAAAGIVVVGALAAGSRPDVRELAPLHARVDNVRTAAWLWSTAPLVGVGFGSYAQASQRVPFAVEGRPAHAHCLPLELAAEFGVLGVAGFVLGTLALIRHHLRLRASHPGLAAAVVVVPVHNFLDFSLYESGVAVPWALLVGWSLALTRAGGPAAPVRELSRLVCVVVAAITIAAIGLAGLDLTSRSRAQHAVDMGDVHAQCRGLLTAARLAPWRVELIPPLAATALATAEPVTMLESLEVVERARRWRPRSAALLEAEGNLRLATGDLAGGTARLWSASDLRPFDPAFRRGLETVIAHLEDPQSAMGR